MTTRMNKNSMTNKAGKTHQSSKANKIPKDAVAVKNSEKNVSATESNQNEKYMWLNNAELQISPDIQRKISPMRVAKIASEFSPLIANPIKVSFRDGKYYVFDGMHTRAAQEVVNGTDNFPILCRVYYGLTKEDEARLFAEQFGIAEAVSMGYRLRALAVAKDPMVLDFLDVTKSCGYGITLGGNVSRNGNITAAVTAFSAFCGLGSDKYGHMLKMLHKTWAGENWSVNRYMLGGMARFLKMYEMNINSFVKAFRGVTYDEIRYEAARFPGMAKDGAFAAALAEIYDRNSNSELRECV